MKSPVDVRVVPSRNEPKPEDLFPADRRISVILDEEDYQILETPRDSPSRSDIVTPMPPLFASPVAPPVAPPVAMPDPGLAAPKKNKPKEFLSKLLRTTSVTPHPSSSKGEGNKWRPTGGGGGRHPVASRVSKEQKLRMINEAVGDFSEVPSRQGHGQSSDFNPVSTGGQRQPPAVPSNRVTTHDPESPEVVELGPHRAESNRSRKPDLNTTRRVEVPNPSKYNTAGFVRDLRMQVPCNPLPIFRIIFRFAQ
jgi:hypothetical protein